MANIGPRKMFGLVVDSATNEPRRLIDTSDDVDDSHLLEAQKVLAADETLFMLALEDYPAPRRPYIIARDVGYVAPKQSGEAPDVVANRDRVKAIILPLVASIRPAVRLAYAARVKTVLASGKMPRNDSAIRNALADEMDRIGRPGIATSLRNGDADASNIVASVTEALWPEISDAP